MLKELFSNRLFMGALAFFILFVIGGTLYISHVEKQDAEELATDEYSVKQGTEKQQQQPTAEVLVGDTSQGGHFHEDGTWHDQPHASPIEVSKPEASADVPAAPDVLPAPVVAQQADTQIDEATLESASLRLKNPDVYKAWVEWSKKNKELSEAFFQAAREDTALLPTTAEELERFDNDPEWQRKHNEALHKTAKIYTMMKAHENKNPLLQ